MDPPAVQNPFICLSARINARSAPRKQRHAATVPGLYRLRGQGQSPIVADNGLKIAAEPAEHDAEQIERRNMSGFRPNHGLQQVLGLFKLARLQRRQAALKVSIANPIHPTMTPRFFEPRFCRKPVASRQGEAN